MYSRKKSFFRTTNLAAEPSDDACQVEPKVEVAKKEAQRCAGSTLQTPAEAPSLHARRTLAQTGARFQSCGLQGCGLQGCGLQGSGAHGSGLTPTGRLAQARHLRAHERRAEGGEAGGDDGGRRGDVGGGDAAAAGEQPGTDA